MKISAKVFQFTRNVLIFIDVGFPQYLVFNVGQIRLSEVIKDKPIAFFTLFDFTLSRAFVLIRVDDSMFLLDKFIETTYHSDMSCYNHYSYSCFLKSRENLLRI